MTGLERKSDIVNMAAYAPLFVNTHNRAWNPDAIVFDNHRYLQLSALHPHPWQTLPIYRAQAYQKMAA